MLQRTTDGGQTWTPCTVPALYPGAAPQVSDIWFSDSLNGWATFYGVVSVPMLWRSTDGGKTWSTNINGNPLQETQFTGPTSVRETPNALTVVEGLGVGIWSSTDSGKDWNTQGTRKNGLDFTGNAEGIATEYGQNSTTTFLHTSDGGLNWANVPGGIQHEAWGVYGIKNSRVFVAAPEDTTVHGVYLPSNILRSTNGGLDWTVVTTLPINTTGAIQGVYGTIYVQNCAGIAGTLPGLYRSMDSGLTWKNVQGPNMGGDPYPVRDTRFAVTGCGDVIYAFDDLGNVWKSTDAGDGTVIGQCVFVDKDTLPPAISIICDTERNLYYLHNIDSGGIFIESISIVDSNRRPVTTRAASFDSLPAPYTPIPIHDSVAFGIAWHPGAMMDSAADDSITIQVIFDVQYFSLFPDAGLNPFDTVYLGLKARRA